MGKADLKQAVNNEALENALARLAAVNLQLSIRENQLHELKQKEVYYKAVFHNSAIGMALVGPDGSWKEVNDSICKIVGYSREELLATTFQQITHPDDLLQDLVYLQELADGKRQSFQMEKRYVHKNGNTIWALLVVSMVKDKQGKLLYYISQIEDITDRKEIEAAVLFSEEKYKSLFYFSPISKWIYDVATLQILDVNEQAIENYGYSRAEFLSLGVKDICTDCEFAGNPALALIGEHNKGRIDFGIEMHRKKNGNLIRVEVSAYPLLIGGNNCMIAVCNDVTEKLHADEMIRLINERYELVMKATFDAIWDWDIRKDTVHWGNGFQTLFGYDPVLLAADKNQWSTFVHPDDLPEVYELILAVLQGSATTWDAEFRFLKANGQYAFAMNKGLVIRAENGEATRIIGAIQDISGQKREEQQLKLFESVITNTSDSVMITGMAATGKVYPIIEYVNEAFTKMTGYTKEEAIGKTPAILYGLKSDKRVLVALKRAIENKTTCEIETINYKKNGEELWVNTSMVPMQDENTGRNHFISISRDITLRKRQEAEKSIFFNLVETLVKLDFADAWAKILETISMYCVFEYAEAWMVNIDPTHMLLHKRWTNNTHTQASFGVDDATRIKKGEGLTGIAWDKGEVCFVSDITNNAAVLCKKFAIENKLDNVVFIPVLFKGHAIAILGFYSTGVAGSHEVYKELFDQIAHQLGPYVQSKRAEDELARFFNLTPDLMAIAGADGYFKKINPSFSRVLGYSSKELFAKPITWFIHPDDRDFTDLKRSSLWQGQQLINFENRYLTKNGEIRWLSWASTPLAEEGVIFAVAKDITEKKKLDEERKRILESISDFFFALDKELNFTYLNAATENLFQVVPGSLIGQNIWKKFPALKKGVFYKNIQKAVKSGERVSFEFFDKETGNWFEESCYPSDDGLSIFFRSINERKVTEKALKEAFEEKDTILESIGDAFFTVDKNWIVTYWNKMAVQYLKISRDGILGKNLWDVFPSAVSNLSYTQYHKAIEQNKTVHFEEFYPPLGIWLEVSAYPSRGNLSVYFKDISVRKKAEESIRTSNERYDLVAKATNDAIWDWDLVTNKVTRPGNRLETAYGYSGREADDVDNFWKTHAHPEDWEKVTRSRNILFENPAENYWEDEYRFLNAAGEYGYVHDKGYIIRNAEGKAIRMIGASKDITREKEQVKGILRVQQNLDSLINTTTDLIWSIDTEFRLIAANKAFTDSILAISGKPVSEGDKIPFAWENISSRTKWVSYYERAFSGEAFDVEESLENPQIRSPWHTIISFTPIIDKKGRITGVACFAKDVTELKKAGQKLLELNSSLEKRAEELAYSNSELERFAYVASHDLQEPLRMVSSFLQLLQMKYAGLLDETAGKYIHFAVDGANRMKQLINDLLHYSRIGSGAVEREPVNMNTVLSEVLSVFKNEILTIEAEIVANNLPVILAGESAMSQLMQNLVGNALKYRGTAKPVIVIDGKEDDMEWTFTVKDNGIGIDQKFNSKIFILFQRLHHKDEFSGTGIGLAICKKIIERYNGKIWVESEFGKGSKFIFVIPKIQNQSAGR
ncbi:MAG: PAS domain S-box protein [Ferruginibacter sp.]